jgi:squalene synthase HpnC
VARDEPVNAAAAPAAGEAPTPAVTSPPASGLPELGEVMAQADAENFPIASRLLPSGVREALLAIYGFARLVDDVGDEAAGDRLSLLASIDEEIDRIYAGGEARNPAIRRMATVVGEYGIPPEPLRRLVEANRRDQEVRRYETFDQLLEYCALSANPVGHMVLRVFAAATPNRIQLADAVCSGLQVTEHIQDVREDLDRGRVYMPQEDLDRFGCSEDDLRADPTPERVRALVAFEVERARELLDRGAPLIRRLRGRPALAVAAFVAGGRSALEAIERAGYEVAGGPPHPSWWARVVASLHTARTALRG